MPDDVSIVFSLPPHRTDYQFNYHLGVGYIQAYLKQNGIGSIQYVPTEAVTLSSMVDDILKLKPEYIGLTCFDSNYYVVKSITRLLKKKRPEIPIIIGGPTATFSDNFALDDCSSVDICVRGEGEETTYELLRKGITDLRGIKGISFREGNSVIRTEDRPLTRGSQKVSELDVLPSPYLEKTLPLDGRAGILTSRGCVYKCTYCNFSAMSRHIVRYHSIDRVIQELHEIDKHVNAAGNYDKHKQLTSIFDDTFSINNERAKEICRRIIAEGISLNLSAETRADYCDAELIELMYNAGIKEINFGLESGVPKVLRNVKKIYGGNGSLDYAPERRFLSALKENVKVAKGLGLNVWVSVIMGLPGENLEDAKNTLRFVKKLGVDGYAHNYLNIFPGTELFQSFGEWDYKLNKSSTILPFETIHPYNVYALQPLPHSNLHHFIIEDERSYLELLAGNFTGPATTSSLSLFTTDIPREKVFYKWLARGATVPFSVYVSGRDTTLKTLNSFTSKCVKHGIPVGKAFFLKRLSSKKHKGSYLLGGRFDHLKQHSQFIEIPWSKYQSSTEKNMKTVLTMPTTEDVEALCKQIHEARHSKFLVLSHPFLICTLKDECRWANEPCPAMNLRRLIIRPASSITTCFNGEIVGNLSSGRQKIVGILESYRKKVQDLRECKECPIKNKCSMCLFPSPLTQKEYCNIRKNNPEIGEYIDLIRTARILLRKEGPLSSSTIDSLSKRVKGQESIKPSRFSALSNFHQMKIGTDFRLVYADNVPYLVDKKTDGISRLNMDAAEILETAIHGEDIDSRIEEFCTKYGEHIDKIVDQINGLLADCVRSGIITIHE